MEKRKQTTLREFIEWLSSMEDKDNTIVQIPGYEDGSIMAGITDFDKDNLDHWHQVVVPGNPTHPGEGVANKSILILGEVFA